MADFIVLRPPKRTRSRRLRKKLHIGEFQTLGFEFELTLRAPSSIELQDRFMDQLLEQVDEPRALSQGGGVNCGFVAARRGSVTEADREAFNGWIRNWPDIAKSEVGHLRYAGYDEAPGAPPHCP
jgi:hypothetical protein